VGGVSEEYRLDVVSVADPDRPLQVEFFEAVDHEAAFRAAEAILRNRQSDPEREYGDMWMHVGDNRAEYCATVDVPAGSPVGGPA
jgi:hypothetical protein